MKINSEFLTGEQVIALIQSFPGLNPAVGQAVIGAPILFFLVFWGGGALSWLLNLVLGIVYGLRANNGEWAGYPGIKYLAAKIAGVELPR